MEASKKTKGPRQDSQSRLRSPMHVEGSYNVSSGALFIVYFLFTLHVTMNSSNAKHTRKNNVKTP